jgi:hypothetical protein
LNSALAAEARGDSDAAVAKTAAIKNIQKALTARILKRLDDGQPLVEVARKMKAIEGMQPQINDMERRLGIMQSVEPVLENAIKTLQKVVDVRGMGKKFLQLKSDIRLDGDEEKKDNVQKAEEKKEEETKEAAKKEEKEAAKTVEEAKAAEGAKGPDAAVAGKDGEDPKAVEAATKDDGKGAAAIPAEFADKPPCEAIEAAKKAAANVDVDAVAIKQLRQEHEDISK